ncbi:response regulator [Scytonema hofmannii FACHB-248]|uniref:Response regulator n=1 Tax=Scytonema hofmannii FACHB-248 TaxID=1842502 RepID=A0ABR8GN08_9CYAN|nr:MULTISPECIES: response regulator [Nostocales]MBD2604612.1 response regulator [Scytonema hofmannii FACHB-248]
MKILVVEDDQRTASMVSEVLRSHNYIVDTIAESQTALQLVRGFAYDLIILDIVLPGLDGISLCRQLRFNGYQMPILLLTVKDSSTDKVMGLDAGADDYMVKPFDVSELVARVRALLRRGSYILASVLTWGKLQLDSSSSKVVYEGRLLRLTATEYRLLQLFLRNPQRIFSRSMILDRLWSIAEYPGEDAVTTHIKKLRQKLKAAGMTADLIETIYGLGYRLLPPPEQTPGKSSLFSTDADRQQAENMVIESVNNIWQRSKESFTSQLVLFEQVVAALMTDTLSRQIQDTAKLEAHKMAGSLGSFGFNEGSRLAHQIEELLESEAIGQQATQLQQLVSLLQQELEKPPVLSAVAPVVEQSALILIIDDDRLLIEQIMQSAFALNLRVEVANSLAAGREAIAQNPPDVILLNLIFADTNENGLTLLAELAQSKSLIPVLVLTIRGSLVDRVEVARLGARAFLHKPIAPEQILKAVTQILNQATTTEARVLIVDNDPQVLTTLTDLLQPWGLDVTTLEDPQNFWEVLTTTVPDLLILDASMPTFSGILLCQVVRQDPHWGDLPIVVLTSDTNADTIRQVFAAGADDYVGKPIVEPELITRIISRLKRVQLW